MTNKLPVNSVEAQSTALLLALKDAWSNLFNVPGLPLRRSRRRFYLRGGLWFWLIVGTFWLFVFAIIAEYAILVVTLRLIWALFLSLCWGIANGVEALKRRQASHQ